MKHIHECTECGDDWECEDENCYEFDGVYILEKVCKGCEY